MKKNEPMRLFLFTTSNKKRSFYSWHRVVNALILEKGLAFIVRHRKEDTDRSSRYDDMLVAEDK